jgi:hypothetical protein
LLTYLHEHAKGFGRDFWFATETLAEALHLPVGEARKAWSYLEGFGLVGGLPEWASTDGEPPLYLTSLGESYMREVEERLADQELIERGKRFGVAALKTGWEIALSVGTSVLSELVQGKVR